MKNNHLKNPITASQKKRLVRLLLATACLMALNAKTPLIEKNKPQLNALCNNISKDEFVLSATIYDQQGILIANSDNWQSHKVYGQILESTPGISKLKTPFIEPVVSDDDRPVGFVSITYLTRAAVTSSHNHFHDLGRQVLLMLVIACIFTWQLGRGLKIWQVNRYIQKTSQHES